jgi:hypothetical protein
MELFQDLTIKLNPNYPGFQQTLLELVEQSSVWKIRKDYQEAFLQRGLLKDRTVICIETPVLGYGGKDLQAIIWTYDYGTWLQTFNIIPSNSNRLSKEEYNFILNEFVRVFINRTAADYHAEVILTKPVMDVIDYVDQDVYDALVLFSEMANKSTGHSHPMDEKRWCEFILVSAAKKRRLSVDYLEGWLVDHGWSSDMANELGLDYEYGLTLLDYEHHRR